MEISSSADNDHEEQQREGSHFYSPCSLFEKAIKACLNCLGLGLHDVHKPPDDHHHPPPHTETEIKSSEDAVIVMAARSARAPVRSRQNKPPISTGAGGQINYSSSVSSS